MNTNVESITDPIELDLAEKAIALAKIRQRWASIKDFYRPIVNAFHRLGIEPSLSSDVDISFSGDASKLAAVVRILRTSGFTTNSDRPKQGDTTWYARYTHEECPTSVWLYFTSSVCKRVKVGTKMVEQDVYEVQCGDGNITDAFPAVEQVQAEVIAELPF
jgi:hypothetical protein